MFISTNVPKEYISSYKLVIFEYKDTDLGYSAHVWVVMNGHFVNPSWLSSSFGRSDRIIDLKRWESVLF
jgi:hypothetical protein